MMLQIQYKLRGSANFVSGSTVRCNKIMFKVLMWFVKHTDKDSVLLLYFVEKSTSPFPQDIKVYADPL